MALHSCPCERATPKSLRYQLSSTRSSGASDMKSATPSSGLHTEAVGSPGPRPVLPPLLKAASRMAGYPCARPVPLPLLLLGACPLAPLLLLLLFAAAAYLVRSPSTASACLLCPSLQ
jgi:hypothetical protein